NLWIAGGAAESDPSLCSGGIANGLTVSGTDSTLGYAARTFASSGANDGANLGVFAADAANPDGWGSALPPGRYTLSLFVKANFGTEMLFGLDRSKPPFGSARITESAEWQRVS